MPEIKINEKDYPKTLRVKIFDKVYNALINLCKSNGAWIGCTVKASSISENNVFVKIIDDESSMACCAFQISENPEHISIRVLDYSDSETDKPSVLPDHDMEIAKIFTNEDPIRGEMIALDKCADLSGAALWAVRSITTAFDIARQHTPELNITWNKLCESDMLVTDIQDNIIKYRCPKCGIRQDIDKAIALKKLKINLANKEDIPSYHVELPNVKATQLKPCLTFDHVIMPSHIAENNKEENEMKENKKCVIERERLMSIVQTFLNNTGEHRPWKNKPGTLETGEIAWSGTKQRGMYFPIIGITIIDPSDDNTGFEIWNTCNGNRNNINIHIDHEGIRFIESSNFNDFGYEFMHDLYEFIKENLDESKIKNQIKDVIFSNPATTVIWTDGTKTTVQTQVLEYTTITKPDGTVVKKPKKRVPFDPEAALAACIMNKLFGSHSAYAKYVNGYVVKSEAKKAKKNKVKKEKEPTPPKKPTKKPNTKARKVTIEGGKK